MRVDSRGILHARVHARIRTSATVAGGPEAEGRDLDDPVRQAVGARRLEVEDDERPFVREGEESAASVSGGRAVPVTPASWPRNGRRGARRLPGPGRAGRHSGRIRPDETRRVQERGGSPSVAPRIVGEVSEKRRAEVKQVEAELVHAARLGHQLDERRLASILEHAIARRGRAARRDGRPSGRAAGRGGIARTRRPESRCPAREGP